MRDATRAIAVALCALMTAAVASGCSISRSYYGSPLRGDPAAVVTGQTTKAEILRNFGPPTVIEHQTDGDAFIYTYARSNYASLTIQEPVFTKQMIFNYGRLFDGRDRVVVLFDYYGVVRGIAHQEETERMPTL
jgi:hypothetical protein